MDFCEYWNYIMDLLKKYWIFPVFIMIISSYLLMKYDLLNTLRKRGKCTIGIVESETKFSSSHYRASIRYMVKNKEYTLISPKSRALGSKVNIVYDSMNPNIAAEVDTCNQFNIKGIKIKFFEKNW